LSSWRLRNGASGQEIHDLGFRVEGFGITLLLSPIIMERRSVMRAYLVAEPHVDEVHHYGEEVSDGDV
jgi:hypothetical protein